jgi:hypothetical protein
MFCAEFSLNQGLNDKPHQRHRASWAKGRRWDYSVAEKETPETNAGSRSFLTEKPDVFWKIPGSRGDEAHSSAGVSHSRSNPQSSALSRSR